MSWVRIDAARALLMAGDEGVGVFEALLGFRTATKKYKAAHMMNDVAQTIVGGAPVIAGDLISRIIREQHEDEDNSEVALRRDPKLGAAFDRAYPRALGERRIRELREAAGMILNHDRTIFSAGDRMTSPLATHAGMLGVEQFRRFRIGPYLSRALTETGRERLRALFTDERDPITRALRPLLVGGEIRDTHPLPQRPPEPSPFDRALGARLSRLLTHPLSKPALLRYFALGASLGIVLKVLGLGRPDGRPVIPAVPADHEDAPEMSRWDGAIQAFQRARDELDARVAQAIAAHPSADDLFLRARTDGAVEVAGAGPVACRALIHALRNAGDEETGIWWPDNFAIMLGRASGCVLPRSDRAGWQRYRLALTPELVETVTLMSVEPSGRPEPWAQIWRRVRDDLGLIIGANPTADTEALREIGVPHVSPKRLRENAALMLRAAVRRGAARALPDGGAEALGTLS